MLDPRADPCSSLYSLACGRSSISIWIWVFLCILVCPSLITKMTNKHGLSQVIWICPGGRRGVKQGSPRAWWTKGSRGWTLQSGVSLADCPPMSFSIVCWQGLPPPTQQIKIQLQTSWGGRVKRFGFLNCLTRWISCGKRRRQKLVIFSTTGIVGSSESQDC